MRTSIRTGIALSISGLATGGVVMLASGAAGASTGAAQMRDPNSPVCVYLVTPMRGLNVRKTPGGKTLGALHHHKIVVAKKCNNPRGWVKLRKAEGLKLKKKYRGKFVYRPYLMNMHN